MDSQSHRLHFRWLNMKTPVCRRFQPVLIHNPRLLSGSSGAQALVGRFTCLSVNPDHKIFRVTYIQRPPLRQQWQCSVKVAAHPQDYAARFSDVLSEATPQQYCKLRASFLSGIQPRYTPHLPPSQSQFIRTPFYCSLHSHQFCLFSGQC